MLLDAGLRRGSVVVVLVGITLLLGYLAAEVLRQNLFGPWSETLLVLGFTVMTMAYYAATVPWNVLVRLLGGRDRLAVAND